MPCIGHREAGGSVDKSVIDQLDTVMDWVRWAASEFNASGLYFGHGTASGLDEAVALVLWRLHLPPDLVPAYWSAKLTRSEREHIFELVWRRIQERVPLPYLTGEAYFAGLKFKVTRDVLIPRSPIAELIEARFEPWYDSAEPVMRVLDLCTGSGCIAIACAYAFPEAEIDAVELSPLAFTVCEQNIAAHALEGRVVALSGDLFEPVEGHVYNIIVSNPPYVDQADMAALPAEYHHEPAMALAAGNDGLDVVRRILREAPDYLTADGILVCEVGNSEAALIEAFPEVPFLWPEFERGGGGVFVISAEQLMLHRHLF
jgi:ribosomal protein L3 glutamine methyltransferase